MNINTGKSYIERKARYYLTALSAPSHIIDGVVDIIEDAMDAVFDRDASFDSQSELMGFLVESGLPPAACHGTVNLLHQGQIVAEHALRRATA